MALADPPRRQPFWLRLFFAIPLIGWTVRDLLCGDEHNVWYAIILYVSLWMISALLFGLPGLYLPALAMVPVIFVLMVLITWG